MFQGASERGAHFFWSGMSRRTQERETPDAPVSRRKRIRDLLGIVERRLQVDKAKVTLADFIRLMQLERELDVEEQPREIVITWKEPAEKQSVER